MLSSWVIISCEEDCRHFIQKAIDAIPATENRQKTTDYIRNKLDGEFERWATYPRFRIPILLQVLTTSPLEGLHASYKADGMKKTMQTFALRQTIPSSGKSKFSFQEKSHFIPYGAVGLLYPRSSIQKGRHLKAYATRRRERNCVHLSRSTFNLRPCG
ncbi:hypothetical protein F4804DRAFT_122981 [Jackrogersella minutella]|nr:hypothetical protein F4804DRAFT_122981 [Jackrogersella minutella]